MKIAQAAIAVVGAVASGIGMVGFHTPWIVIPCCILFIGNVGVFCVTMIED